jgi:hypothetical protein
VGSVVNPRVSLVVGDWEGIREIVRPMLSSFRDGKRLEVLDVVLHYRQPFRLLVRPVVE